MSASEESPRRRGRPPSGGREAILEAALTVLRDHGIAHLTSREVAARAGVSDASVYYHFRDRAGLLEAMFERGMKPLLFLQDAEDGDPRAVLRQAAASLEAFFDDVLPILHAAQSDAELRPIVAEYIERKDVGPHRGVENLAGYLRAQQQAGRVNRRANPDAVAMLLIDATFARCVRRHMLIRSEERLPSREALLDEIGRLLEPT